MNDKTNTGNEMWLIKRATFRMQSMMLSRVRETKLSLVGVGTMSIVHNTLLNVLKSVGGTIVAIGVVSIEFAMRLTNKTRKMNYLRISHCARHEIECSRLLILSGICDLIETAQLRRRLNSFLFNT